VPRSSLHQRRPLHIAAASLNEMTMTGRAATLEDVGAIAAFVASDKARTMTAATVSTSAGALID
jgi:3-oxoacyl-[acyl-carrier protein] reductase